MATAIAIWPDNTLSVLRLPCGFTDIMLYDMLDDAGDPLIARVFQIKADDDGRAHIGHDWNWIDSPEGKTVTNESCPIRPFAHEGRLRELMWKPDVKTRWWRMKSKNTREHIDTPWMATVSIQDLDWLPAAPSADFTVKEVQAMQPFSGVYFSYDADGVVYYIGESADVTKRVSSSRPEIGHRRLGVIKCKPEERKRLEAFFVGLLDPPGNAVSTHRMSKKQEATDGR